MDKVLTLFGLKKEAVLLDSWLYILKSMVAISLGFLLGRAFSITRLDMVSVLLGVMYNLEAVNVSGLKGGINQMVASTLAALCTGTLVYLTGYQISVLTIALGMGLTLYIALKIDYRMVSPVAIFTSVYMTQLLQHNAQGVPSVLQTFLVRIAALGLGVLIALSVNFLFSIIYYRKIGKKRLEFVKLQGVAGLRKTYEVLSQNKGYPVSQSILAGVFNDIEMVKANLATMMKENKLPFNRKEKKNLDSLYAMILIIKTIIHLAYDCVFINEEFKTSFDPAQLDRFKTLVERLASMDFTDNKPSHTLRIDEPDQTNQGLATTDADFRLRHNLDLMEVQFNRLVMLCEKLADGK
jgi:hypothetical protein